jgi:hypothetical protein
MNSKQALDKIMKILNLTPQKFYEAKTDQGIAVKIDGDLELGAPIYVATDEGMIPAPAGTHKLDDGSEIEVDEEGKVSKIKMGAMPDAKLEDKKEKESIKDENMSENFADVKMKDGKVVRVEGEEPTVGLMVKLVNYDGTLTAITDGVYEAENGKKINIVGGSIQGVDEADESAAEKFTEAKTADGVIVESPTFDVGEDLMVVKDGEKSPAPDGEHQVVLKDSEGNDVKIRVMTKDGKIVERENVEEMEDDMMSAEEVAELFSQALKKIESKIDQISAKQKELEGKFQKFSSEPAGQKVFTQKTINENFSKTEDKLESFKRLKAALNRN